MTQVNQDCANIGRIVAYAAYNLYLPSLAVGLVRTAISVALYAKFKICEKQYGEDSARENRLYSQLFRGAVELIPGGAIYFTYQDNLAAGKLETAKKVAGAIKGYFEDDARLSVGKYKVDSIFDLGGLVDLMEDDTVSWSAFGRRLANVLPC